MKVPEFDKHEKEGRRTYRPKRYGNNNKDVDNSLKTLNDKKVCNIYNIQKIFYIERMRNWLYDQDDDYIKTMTIVLQ